MSGDILYCLVQPTVEVAESWGVRVLKRMDYIYILKFVYLLDINSSEAFKKEGVTNDNFRLYLYILYPLDSCLRNLLCVDQALEEPISKTKSWKRTMNTGIVPTKKKKILEALLKNWAQTGCSECTEWNNPKPTCLFQTWLPASMLTTFQQVERVWIPYSCLSGLKTSQE